MGKALIIGAGLVVAYAIYSRPASNGLDIGAIGGWLKKSPLGRFLSF